MECQCQHAPSALFSCSQVTSGFMSKTSDWHTSDSVYVQWALAQNAHLSSGAQNKCNTVDA